MRLSSAPTADRGRRDFLKLGFTGSALLAGGALTAGLSGCSRAIEPAAGYRFLRSGDAALFAAIAPAILGGALPQNGRAAHLQALLQRLDGTCSHLQSPAHTQLRQLFDLLDAGLTRRLTTGVSAPWAQAESAQVQRFIERWRSSSVGLFNSGYRVLAKLVTASWMQTEGGQRACGYPGPWAPMFAAVNA
ncbi:MULTISPECIES: hypothetical protein [Hydrocarboniphaga]|jgi:hypothetical protein|uniref:Twin-arginine translocation pathway signal protein n=1 Tax=Hydrocarboniphaga effusa AP103 TaxID=1172194 RepID=I8I4K7_9GAMM|nr:MULTISPECIES: hypothetical protein [Hydrocarboniphaga]EIT71176.1 hypothetical protein WQQ_13130 [Hydrocarboniphaga effusa AP103]MDZ4079466.1 hypothetical protein [Hydrocarboniphaga sp.]